jgi:hypothetical protein
MRANRDADQRRANPRVRAQSSRPQVETYSARAGTAVSERADLSAEQATEELLAVIGDSVQFAPTLVVWLIDVSPSAAGWGREIHSRVRRFYEETVPGLIGTETDRLETAVWTIGRAVEERTPRTGDPSEVVRALDSLSVDESGREVTFEAVQRALEAFVPARVEQRREVLLIIISDEAGDDWQKVDQLVHEPRKYAVPIYVIGVPAPFGRLAALSDSVEAGAAVDSAAGSWRPILQGPESRAPERIHLKTPTYEEDLELIDSGFGPFGLEYLTRASGGAYLCVRRSAARDFSFTVERNSWPLAGSVGPDPEIMQAYRPELQDAEAYQQQLNSNRALMALHQAAQLPPAEVLRDPQLTFLKRSEADLKNVLDKAQQAAAKVAPAVDQLYELLRDGAVDAEQLRAPRLRAGFDLAFGRVCAAKARIDGYNSMLAALKRGKSFEDESSTTWVLQRAGTCDASSSLEKLIDRAKTLLQRVVDQHPGTPWARIARRELEEPIGWEWTEQ